MKKLEKLAMVQGPSKMDDPEWVCGYISLNSIPQFLVLDK
tara:strand:- start:10 stop:129 length:120 start_codon:yes stop_codon:yes gene_type:complete